MASALGIGVVPGEDALQDQRPNDASSGVHVPFASLGLKP